MKIFVTTLVAFGLIATSASAHHWRHHHHWHHHMHHMDRMSGDHMGGGMDRGDHHMDRGMDRGDHHMDRPMNGGMDHPSDHPMDNQPH